MANIVPLHSETHGDLKILEGDFSHVADQHIIPVVVHEIATASADFPIVFVKNADNDQYQSVAMLGLKPQENLFIKGKKWDATYIPGVISNYPFKLMSSGEKNDQLMVAIVDDAPQVGTKKGEAIFNEDGTETEYMVARKKGLRQYFEHSQMTAAFIAELAKLDLLAARSLTLDVKSEKITLDGLYFVDEEKLNALPDDKFLDLRKRGFLAIIYAHLASLNQIRSLVHRKSMKK